MTLFWFVIGIFAILCIARYNESDKLFWQLFASFIGAFLAVTVMCKYIDSKKQNKVEYVTSIPTQVLYSGSRCCVLADPSVSAANEATTSDPVSKVIMSDIHNLVLSKVAPSTRDQPTTMFDTS